MTAYTQTWSDVEARIGSPAKAGQIAGNFNTLIMLRVKEVATAELLTSQLPEVHVVSTVVSSSVSDTNDPVDFADFASRNEDRIAPETVRMLEPTDLVQLPKGEAFALIPRRPAAQDPHAAALGVERSADADEPGGDRETLRARLDGPWNQPEELASNRRIGVSSRNAAFHDGALAGVLLSPLKLAFSLAWVGALLLCAWIVDWDVRVQGLAAGDRAPARLLAHDLAGGIALAARQGAGAGVITAPANALYSIVFEATGIHDMGTQFANGSALSIPDTIMRRSYVSHRESIEAAMVGTQLLGVRAAILARFAPLPYFHAVGAADGFTSERSAGLCGGRESASLYHRAKYLQVAVLGLGGVCLLLWPGPVRWELCVALGAVLTGGWPACSGRTTRSTCSAAGNSRRPPGAALDEAGFPGDFTTGKIRGVEGALLGGPLRRPEGEFSGERCAMDVGSAIRLCRNGAASQTDVATRAECSVSYLSMLENNKRDPTLSMITKIAEALHVPVGRFCDGIGREGPGRIDGRLAGRLHRAAIASIPAANDVEAIHG